MKIGCLMMSIASTSLNPEERKCLMHPHIGGVLLFTRNYQDREQLKTLIQEIRGVRDPLLIAVDHEGGRVQRFRGGFTRLPPVADFGRMYASNAAQAVSEAKASAYTMASELTSLGIDISFAPVLDLAYGASEIIGDRSFHRDPEVVTLLASAYIEGMNKAGMKATGKHFPGHGHVVEDSHEEMPTDDRDVHEIFEDDILPFMALKDRLWGVMPAHIQYAKADKDPAGFSVFWLQKILREKIGFTGAIISDDLSMKGAASLGETYPQRAKKALSAGCDMLIVADHSGLLEILRELSYEMSTASEKRLLAGLL